MDGRPIGIGSVALIRQPLQPVSRWVVTEFVAGQHFAWETRRTGLRMVGTHELTAVEGGTRNVLRIDAEGWLAVLLWPVIRGAMRKALVDENRGLNGHVQATGDAGTGERLAAAVFFPQCHQARHFGFGDLDLLAAEIGERKIADHIVAELGLGLGGHVNLLEKAKRPPALVRRSRAAPLAAASGKCKYKDIFICG